MGRVFEAVRRADQRRLAVKFAVPHLANGDDAIAREIRALSALRHPGLVRMHDQGTSGGVRWYAMDLGVGSTLQAYARRRWSPYRRLCALTARTQVVFPEVLQDVAEVVPTASPHAPLPPIAAGRLVEFADMFRSLCRAVSYLHGEGCVHGDLKPSNILLTERGPTLIDFGQSRMPGDDHFPQPSGGTVEYSAPELFCGAPARPESDLYALGCIFYEFATGHLTFTGHPGSVLLQRMGGAPLLASRLVRNVPAALDQALAGVLSERPSSRYAALESLLDSLPSTLKDEVDARSERG